MQMKTLARLGRYLQTRRNFLIYSFIVIGIPGAIGLVWMFGEYGSASFWLFLALLAFFCAYLWGVLMWHLFMQRFSDTREKSADKSQGRPDSPTSL
jgi:hypothetical protein